jgi:hypothetical protein
MPVVINEVVTEVVLGPDPAATAARPSGGPSDDELMDLLVRRATERVLEVLRREWEL